MNRPTLTGVCLNPFSMSHSSLCDSQPVCLLSPSTHCHFLSIVVNQSSGLMRMFPAHKISERRLCFVKLSLFNYGYMYLCASPYPVWTSHNHPPLYCSIEKEIERILLIFTFGLLKIVCVGKNNKYCHSHLCI